MGARAVETNGVRRIRACDRHASTPPAAEAPRIDQVQMDLPPQAAVDPAGTDASAPGADKIAAVVTAALEGPEVNLDALLGPAPQPAQPPLLAIASGGLLTDHIGPVGHAFMAGFAEQHVAAQLDQAAAGHA